MPTNIGDYGWTVPENEDSPSGPAQFTELAMDINGTVKGIDVRVGTNTTDITALKTQTPYCQVKATAALANVASGGAGTAIPFAAEDFDTHNMHDNVTNNTRLVCKLAGVYSLFGACPWPTNATGRRAALWYFTPSGGSAAILPLGDLFFSAGSGASPVTVPAAQLLVRMALNDYLELYAFHDAGAPLSTYWSSNYAAYAGCRYVGP